MVSSLKTQSPPTLECRQYKIAPSNIQTIQGPILANLRYWGEFATFLANLAHYAWDTPICLDTN